ncbi:MAG: hypothetical protein IT265_06080 [Saprospiraceae bacterium]|nr:hypothetical protein [Saprospiraceae bacterium]
MKKFILTLIITSCLIQFELHAQRLQNLNKKISDIENANIKKNGDRKEDESNDDATEVLSDENSNLSIEPIMAFNTLFNQAGGINPNVNVLADGSFDGLFNKKWGRSSGFIQLSVGAHDKNDRRVILLPNNSVFGFMTEFDFAPGKIFKMNIPIGFYAKLNYCGKKFEIENELTANIGVINVGAGIELTVFKNRISFNAAYDEFYIVQGNKDFLKIQTDNSRTKFDNLSFGCKTYLNLLKDNSGQLYVMLNLVALNSRNRQFIKSEDTFIPVMDFKFIKSIKL